MEKRNRPMLEIAYTPEAVNDLAQRILDSSQGNTALGKNTVVCITGGSSTGKSSQVAVDLHKQLSADSQIIAQDNFQLGIEYPNLIDTIYCWDDPANYGLDESVVLLSQLKNGNNASLPQYSFHERKRMGILLLTPTPIVLFEGLYAGSEPLGEVADWVIYAEAPLYARLLKRIFRNVFERYRSDPAVVCKNFLDGGVLKAHHDLVIRQRQQADIIFRMPYCFGKSIQQFGLEKINRPSPASTILLSHPIDEESYFQVEMDGQGGFSFNVYYLSDLYYSFPIDQDTYQLLHHCPLESY